MNIRKLTKELQRKAKVELNEDPVRMQDDVKHIREWLHAQPHLCFPDDDQTLVLFLRLRKYGLQQTKAMIDNFCSMISQLPEIFTDRDVLSTEMQAILNANIFAALPDTEDAAGPRIFMIRLNKCNLETMSLLNIQMVCATIVANLMQEDDVITIGGLSAFVDFEGFPLSYILQINLELTVRIIKWVQKVKAVRVKRITFINVPSAVETVYNSVKHLVSEILAKRVNLYSKGNAVDLYKEIPPSILPKEYGGTGGNFDELSAMCKQKVEKNRSWFLNDKLYRTNEKLRPRILETSSEVGIDGSFRKLCID